MTFPQLFPNEAKHPPVGDTVLQEPHHPIVVDRIEVAADVRIEDPADLLRANSDGQGVQCLVSPSPWSESV
jgi:hypothetical protein